ncbi:SNF2-related protein [Desulfobaculum bizertense]|uniref:Helicase conserved C-terminal domain-containing protein n=1 Tax=Desulfobaculum bizertense DSM 18034 TaxID=1121442 RepID=A0A1T4VYU8_9BACT|nr:SNF2-related protein [Desulfobaculum bizertense]SKA70069.1 Helicase conserved C-terminal domain-containing protein [Desulfobaculum bizertense DSM 18034]
MPDAQPLVDFEAGQQVIDINNPSLPGIYTGRHRKAGSAIMVELRFPNGTTKFRPLSILEIVNSEATKDLKEQVKSKRFGRLIDLQRLVTYEKLKGTLHEVIYSMEAAQIDFYPYQFKPVLKFINSPTERLILADEVGLGKTIESGLVWTEMQARYRSNRLLVVCPRILAEKWREELRGKFQLDAQIVDFNGLRHAFDELKVNGPEHSFVLIGTYTGLRPPKAERAVLKIPPEEGASSSPKTDLLRELRFWDEEYPPLDMVIFDEAHNMRNQATTTFHLGECLSANARAVLCVSATPVNNSNIDLHSLLRLVDEDFFSTQSSFDDLIDLNRPSVHAANALSQSPVDVEALKWAVKGMEKSEYINESPLFEQFLKKLDALDQADFCDAGELSQCQDIVEKLNLLGSYVNRTRRVQVKENRPQRVPQVVSVEYTSQEMSLYQAILNIVRQRCKVNKKAFHVFQVMTLQLMAASCLPAFSERILSEQLFDDENLIGEALGDSGFESVSSFGAFQERDQLNELLEYDFEKNDSKFKELLTVVKAKKNEKIIVFAYYRPTLSYLRRRLLESGEDVAIIHGGIPMANRWAEIERFRNSTGPRILLASEVGSEGIDLQFCHVIVNYDLPWNPMRVEQRIGRIDRVGQKARRLLIINFKIAGTIEERIHERLHEKLEIFKNSLGDLDEVIGEEVKKLTISLLGNELTADEERRKIAQTQQAIENKLNMMRELEASGDAFIAFSDYVQKKVEEDRGRGRYIQPAELESYISDFFARHFKGTEINYNTPINGCLRIRLSEDAKISLGDFIHGDQSLSAKPLRRKEICITFSREVMQKLNSDQRRRIFFVNHLSPLIRWVTQINKDKEHNFYKLAAIRAASESVPSGVYLYRVERWVMKGINSIEKLAYGLINLDTGMCYSSSDSEIFFQEIINDGRDWDYRDYDEDVLLCSFDVLEENMQEEFDVEVTQFEIENKNILQTKSKRVATIFDRRIEQDKRRLETLMIAEREERVCRMARGRLAKAKENKAQRLKALKESAKILPETEPVAVGIVRVER